MPLMQTSGNVTADAYAGGAAAKVNYIEDCFVTWLSTGNGTSRTVTGPDMTAGGLSITKSRSAATGWHWVDTARGVGLSLSSNTTSAQATESTGVTAFTVTGTSIGSAAEYNTNGATYVDYLLKKQPKFFDVVTYTGTGSPTTIAHSLGSAPGCIIVKRTDSTSNWIVYHRGISNSYLKLDLTSANDSANAPAAWGNDTVLIAPTSSVFYVGSGQTNQSGATYVAYIFAHNAGGFGLTGTDNVISCGSFTTNGSGNATVSLGYEPQWVLIKKTNGAENWIMGDVMRGMSQTSTAYMYANLTNAEASTGSGWLVPNATGFDSVNNNLSVNSTYIYIAIRRGPMKVPTDGTKVFANLARSGTNSITQITSLSFPPDLSVTHARNSAGTDLAWFDKLRGPNYRLSSATSASEPGNTVFTDQLTAFGQTGVSLGDDGNLGVINYLYNYANWYFRRAPGFFDEVCDTGTGAAHTISHNLQAVPELMIRKCRSSASNWSVYSSTLAATERLLLNNIGAKATDTTAWNSTAPTSSVFTVGTGASVNTSADNYVTYLFATCPGVSKVGTYTGNGTTQTINCGFTDGARFVLIKRTDSTGDWYVYDTARGMTTLTDPYLRLNSTAAESATLGSVTSVTTGFAVNASILSAINTNAASYIYLAIS